MKFFKNCCNGGGGWEIFTRNRGKPGMGGGGLVYNGRDGKLLKSLCIVDRGVLKSLFYKDFPYIAYPPFFLNFVHPPPTSLSPPTYNPTALSAVMFIWLNGWSCYIWCVILLNDNMDLQMSNPGTLVPEGPWCAFYATRHQSYWGLTHNVVFYCWYSDLILHTHKNLHSTHMGQ